MLSMQYGIEGTWRRGALATIAMLLASCAARPRDPSPGASLAPDSPYVLVLGTAQDGGLPHLGCNTGNCAAARADPSRRRLVTSLMLCDPRDGRRWLFDCTPDVREQEPRWRDQPASRAALRKPAEGTRAPLFDGMFLTHAHMGHYGGLLELGREAYAAKELDTWVTPRFAEFLTKNGPWSMLVDKRMLVLHELVPGAPVSLAPDLSVTALLVPHRPEFSDTVAFVLRGPKRALLYLPDIDKWERWDDWTEQPAASRRIEEVVASVDFALIDGCFDADGEIPGRAMKDIPHPFIAESIARFAPLPPAERAKIRFTHLNHTNPAADPTSDAARAVRDAGMNVLGEGEIFGL